MRKLTVGTALLLALPLSTIVVACGKDVDTRKQSAQEREALNRDLELALQPDTTVEPDLRDVPAPQADAAPEPLPPPPPVAAPAPEPAPRRTPPPPRITPRRPQPAPEPAPEPSAPAAPRVVAVSVPAGTNFALRMDERLSTESSRAGSGFTATLVDPIVAADGTTLVPAGASVRGQVTDAKDSRRAGQQAYLKVDFTTVSFGGRSYPIQATAVDVPVKLVNRDSNTEKAAKVGGGAAIGAVLGQVIGKNTKSTVIGAAVGAAAGTAVAVGSADVDAVIPQGSRVVIRLDQPIRVEM